ncbi:methyltransferase domain-containing protein [Pararhodospirillum oryzae]|uniref:Methyltransferase type 11 domain-containing protein n=1 Tax=Pararhodospirillum oryzae TaxID=478448 RepID=A0A512H9Q7_9PROT|nr:methyltransferase domain-containing protein [Pararhodospirillum oryzae]GEO82181.1 hypothetical protein ROR02_23120 [Pararhodospirillum oryzae]
MSTPSPLPFPLPTELRINLCSGSQRPQGFVNIDQGNADLALDLDRDLLPFPDNSALLVVCMSAINYFSRDRAVEIVRDVHRVLKPGGVARFGVQDLAVLARKYLEQDAGFFFQKLPNGMDRFPGATFADKLNGFFYGFAVGSKHCRYVYDFPALKALFQEAGFTLVEQRGFQESRFPEAAALDNRPEQMFYLEAVKAPQGLDLEADTLKRALAEDQAQNRLYSEEAWQRVLRLLDLTPGDRSVVEMASTITLTANRPEEAVRAWEDYLAVRPGDVEAINLLQALRQTAQRQQGARQALMQQQRPALRLAWPAPRNTVEPDRAHLESAMSWLLRSQAARTDGGSSAQYMMDQERWDVSYPETTGYIIPSLLAWERLSGDERALPAARRMADWEIRIQSPTGGTGEALGHYIRRPRVFNTGQVLLGWVALARRTGEAAYRDAALRAARWIIRLQEADGRWENYTYAGARSYKVRVAWALLEVARLTGDDACLKAGLAGLAWTRAQIQPNGWFANTSLTDPQRPWTHLIGYTQVGLLESLRCCERMGVAVPDREGLLALLHVSARGNVAGYLQSRKPGATPWPFLGLRATYAPDWSSNDAWSCVTGNAQIAFFLRRLMPLVHDPLLTEAADLLISDLKRTQFPTSAPNVNLQGGLPGADPMEAPYVSFGIPNWGVKFFADALLERLLVSDEALDCIG